MPTVKKILYILAVYGFIFFASADNIRAIYNPLQVPNNHYGIHIANIQDLDDAANLVNTEGGDWGYVTLVIQKGERDPSRWQNVFDKMRRLHLIPIVRIATTPDGANWEKPKFEEIDSWISFLNSLNWVIKNRYVVIGNEVNLGREWGGEVNPEEYAMYLKFMAQNLKLSNPDFFVIPAGLDASLPTSKTSLDESLFIKRMIQKEPDMFDFIDGWASHSYPNPAFSGSEYAVGRKSIRTFEWELAYLKNLGVKKDLPVFITETGWTKNTVDNLESRYKYAFENVWNDKRIVAVTPFILNYEFPPFDNFSWKSDGFYDTLYASVQDLIKNTGRPIQNDIGTITRIFVPSIAITNSSFSGVIFVTNKGESIWSAREIEVKDLGGNNLTVTNVSYNNLEPGSSGLIFISGDTPKIPGVYKQGLFLLRNGKVISNIVEFNLFLFRNLTWPPSL